MQEANHFKIGLFISIGTLLFVALLFVVGLRDYFEEKFMVYTYTSESVQGLEVGSPVKYQGVAIGKVEDISIVKENYVQIDMAIRPRLMMKNLKVGGATYAYLVDGHTTEDIYVMLKKVVADGLRCKVDYAGITGLKYVEIHYSPEPHMPLGLPLEREGYIPSSVSAIAGTVGSIQELLTKVLAINFTGVETDLRAALVAVKELAKSPDVAAAIIAFDKAMRELRKTGSEVTEQVSSGGDELKQTLRSVRLFLEMLEEDPSSIIGGKQKKR